MTMRIYRSNALRRATPCVTLALAAVVSVASFTGVSAQDAPPPRDENNSHRVGPKPRPFGAVQGIIAAFDKYPLVAVGEDHGLQELYDFFDQLVKTPAFAEKVNDIVVECGNALHQDVMDRYVTGEDVPRSELQKVWRTSTQAVFETFDSPIYEHLFVTVRAVNQTLPREKRLRVLLGDPPIDWSQIHTAEQAEPILRDRDHHYARVVENEVLRKERKALMIAGLLHFTRSPDPVKSHPDYHPNVTDILEQRYPGTILRVVPHMGFIHFDDPDRAKERRLESYMPAPWAAYIKETWVGKTQKLEVPDFIVPGGVVTYLEDRVDVLLYLGPGDQLTKTGVSPFFYAVEQDYFREKNRMALIVFGEPLRASEPHYTSNVIPGIFLRGPSGPPPANNRGGVSKGPE